MDRYKPKSVSPNKFSCSPPVRNLMEIHSVVSQMELTDSICFRFMHFVQITHNRKCWSAESGLPPPPACEQLDMSSGNERSAPGTVELFTPATGRSEDRTLSSRLEEFSACRPLSSQNQIRFHMLPCYHKVLRNTKTQFLTDLAGCSETCLHFSTHSTSC